MLRKTTGVKYRAPGGTLFAVAADFGTAQMIPSTCLESILRGLLFRSSLPGRAEVQQRRIAEPVRLMLDADNRDGPKY
jgi:hypothetical protein